MVTENYTLVKRCIACANEKPLSDFYTWPSTGKPRPNCKDCTNAARRAGPPRRVNFTETGKICTRCRIDKPFSAYSFHGKNKKQIRSRCKECVREAHTEWNDRNRDVVNGQASAWRGRNPELVKSNNQNRRALMLAAEGSFGASDIKRLHGLQRGRCAACFKALGGAYHIDHREPLSKGGSNRWTNLQLLHAKCNIQKRARDPIEYMQTQHGMLL